MRFNRIPTALSIAALLAPLFFSTGAAAQDETDPPPSDLEAPRETAPPVPLTGDFVLSGDGDEEGFHLIAGDASDPDHWVEIAVLREPGFETDRWIGQYCVTGSGGHAAVVYAPREFANYEAGMYGGAFAAVVDLSTGAVEKLPERTSLAYYNPGCGVDDRIVMSALDSGGESGVARTRLQVLEPGGGSTEIEPIEVAGQLSSPVPYGDGIAAAKGGSIVDIDAAGTATPLSLHGSVPFDLRPDRDGGLGFQVLDGEESTVVRYAEAELTEIAHGDAGSLRLSNGVDGRVRVVGVDATAATETTLPDSWATVDVPAAAEVSVEGGLAVLDASLSSTREPAFGAAAVDDAEQDRIQVTAYQVEEGETVETSALRGHVAGADTASPALAAPQDEQSDFGANDVPWDPDRACAMPRNDPDMMVYQPTPDQVEWAVDLAVRGQLTDDRPADWNNLGLRAFSPQAEFPPRTLSGGGDVPAQIMLGILAQESNFWHASRHAADGYSGNTHQGGFYGNRGSDGEIDWIVDWDEVDCGYGVAQVTTGMHSDDTVFSEFQQQLVMLDYASNIAAGLQILQDKWNQTRNAGLIMNDGDPQYLQNWWFAVWAYNSGFYPESDKDQHHGQWGLGWLNNPVNPIYMPGRDMFLFTDNAPEDWEGLPDNWDAESWGYGNSKHPNLWSYPERVIGWAYKPLIRWDFGEGQYRDAYVPADGITGNMATPGFYSFCEPEVNNCDPEGDWNEGVCEKDPSDPNDDCLQTEPTPCGYEHLHCWWTEPVDLGMCPQYCGTEVRTYTGGSAEPARPTYSDFEPNCASPSIPDPVGYMRVVDSVPEGQSGPNSCSGSVSQSGSFEFEFGTNPTTPVTYPSKIDLHQIGGGYRGHFWFAHTRHAGQQNMEVQGTWTLDQADRIDGWAKVYVHVPSRHAFTQQAPYQVHGTTHGVRDRYLNTVFRENTWVELGAYEFDPSLEQQVTLTNITDDGVGLDGITYDAVAFVPLAEKPKHMVVAMGDSYISGEGAGDYYTETDRDFGQRTWNACRRSRDAWPRQIVPPGWNYSFGANADVNNKGLDFQFIGCSGAKATQFDRIPDYWSPGGGSDSVSGQFREYPQLRAGVLSPDTTLVLLSISGNDAGWSGYVRQCVTNTSDSCVSQELRDSMTDSIDGAIDLLQAQLDEITALAPNATVLVVGYPSIFSPDPYNDGTGGCTFIPTQAKIAQGESILFADMAGYFDAAASNAAAISNVHYASTVDYFSGHEICNPDNNPYYFNTVILGNTGPGDDDELDEPSRESFHPNSLGVSDGYTPAVEDALEDVYG